MKTRMITAALFTVFATSAFSLTTDAMSSNIIASSNIENAVFTAYQLNTENQLSNDESNLNDWYVNRESWEQQGVESATENTLMESTTLEEWVTERGNWEQHSKVTPSESVSSGSVILEQWISGVESWEQE